MWGLDNLSAELHGVMNFGTEVIQKNQHIFLKLKINQSMFIDTHSFSVKEKEVLTLMLSLLTLILVFQ